MPLDPHGFAQAQIAMGAVDWSGQPAEGIQLHDLDPVEIGRARNILQRINPESELLKLDDTGFLVGLGAIRQGRVTRAGFLLFGRDHQLSAYCPQHQIHYVYEASDIQVLRNDSYRFGLLNVLERIESAFTGPANPEQEISVGLFKLRVPAYPIEVVRESPC